MVRVAHAATEIYRSQVLWPEGSVLGRLFAPLASEARHSFSNAQASALTFTEDMTLFQVDPVWPGRLRLKNQF